jgi:hypothetical protein
LPGSHVRAEFAGRRKQEFTWFSLGASLPLVSMEAERAARQIVAGMAARRPELKAALQERWAASVRERAQLAPRSIVPVLDAVLAEQRPIVNKIRSQIAPKKRT